MKKKSFVKGAAILAAAGLISKFIGALFRIPLINIIGSDGIGLYQMAYPVYAFLLIISTAGIPTAISKLVSEKLAMGQPREAHRVFQISFKLMLGIGLSTFVLFFAGSGTVARMVGSERALYSILAISPSLIFVSLISAYRGYFQGMQIMTPTALSQIVEQVGKLLLGLWFAMLFIGRGVEYGAAAAVVGVTLSEGVALALLVGIYMRRRKDILSRINKLPKARYSEDGRSILFRLARVAIPVTIGASIMPLVNVADLVIVVNRLTQIGFSQIEAEKLFGLLTGGANPLINFPAVLTIALAMSLVPAISESYAAKNHRETTKKIVTGIRLTLILGLPAAAGMAVLAHPICALLYSKLSPKEIFATGEILAILSLGIVFLTLVQTLTAILQGINRVTVPVRNLMIGALFKVVLTYALVGNPSFHVRGAAIGTVVCYGVAAILDFAAVIRYTRIRIPFKDFIVKPMMAVAIMTAFVYGVYRYTEPLLGSEKATLAAILVGAFVYGLTLLLSGALGLQDFNLLPGGKNIGRLLRKFKWIKE